MAGLYGHSKMAATIAASASTSAVLPISGFSMFALEVPAMTNLAAASATVYMYVAQSETDTFRPLASSYNDVDGDNSLNWRLSNCVGNQTVICESLPGFKFCQVVVSVSATAAAGWPVVLHCMQY
jgi:hypothetical protein